ncbi:MAG: hypothetical protein GWN87_10085, partial [Desulfuromonadales bacterium]|nr:hypothetical protein [Desulfuromonadales bacterium]
MAEEKKASASLQVKAEKSPVPVGNRGIVLQSFEDLQRFAESVQKSGIAPKGMS